ncbi:MAG: hypothetical protein L3K00_04455 [Thermoplasmata archaeon]|nr:hypothetical protein [Thermoplasmata archaeon]
MGRPAVPLLLASLALTAVLLGSGLLLPLPGAAPRDAPSGTSRLVTDRANSGPRDDGAAALAAASDSLTSGAGRAVLPWGPTAPSRSPFPSLPSLFPGEPGGPHRSTSVGWSLLGSSEGHFAGAMAYDGSDGYVLEFGGVPDAGSTWTFANGTWTNRTLQVTGSPSPRAVAAMTYDAFLDEIVLFGGLSERPNGSTEPLNDTWTYHAGTWTNVTSSAGVPPAARDFAGFAYDPNDSADVLFGGDLASGSANDTWEFDAGHWVNLTANQTASPYGEGPLAMAEDGTDGDVVLLGGGNASSPFGNETWTFSGGRWANVTAMVGTAPSARSDPVAAMDSTDGGVVVFGGYGPSLSFPVGLMDTWRFVHDRWTEIASGPPAPNPRVYAMLSDDPGGSGLLLYGGYDVFNSTYYTDTWTFAAGAWDLLTAGTSPNPRAATTLAFDSTSGQVILFGGSGLNDTWSYAGGSWTELHPSRSPPGRLGATLSNDPSDAGLVLFGGEAIVGGPTPVRVYNDTWVWANGTWSNVTATAPGPPARILAASVYDSTTGDVVLYGGANFGSFHDTWTFHSGTWTEVNATGPVPSASAGVGLADDPANSGVLLFGGSDPGNCPGPNNFCNQTWTFSNGTWTNRTVAASPSIRESPGLSYDPSLGADVLYGGTSAGCYSIGPNATECTSILENDTWSYRSGHWTNLTTTFGTPPASGIGYTLTDDVTDGYLLLFGSFDAGYSDAASGSWWSLTTGTTSGSLTVSTPVATANPTSVGHSTLISVVVSGGLAPYSIAWDGLPTGCGSANSTALDCAPSEANTYLITVHVTDSLGSSATSPALTLNVTATPPLLGSVSIVPGTPSVAIGGTVPLVAQAFDTGDQTLQGVTFAWTVRPTNLASLNVSTGPRVALTADERAGTVAVQASATWDGTTLDAGVTVTIFDVTGVPLDLVAFTATPTNVTVGSATVLTTVVSGGTSPYSFAYSGLPASCASGNVANLSCTPSAAGTYTVEVQVTDTGGAIRTANVSLTVTGTTPSPSTGAIGGLTTAEWLGVGALVLVVLAVASIVVLRGRRRPPVPSDDASPVASGPPT